MSAGTGKRYAEFNRGEVPLKIYQIWLLPRNFGGEHAGIRSRFREAIAAGASWFSRAASTTTRGPLPIRSNARLLGATLKAGAAIRQELGPSRRAYLVVASGRIEVNGELMEPLDGAAITNVAVAEISGLEEQSRFRMVTRETPFHGQRRRQSCA
jgi:redox-sensitive bicupin YhaK (pirin superfamily)